MGMGGYPKSSICRWIFHYKPSSYWGTPHLWHTMETPTRAEPGPQGTTRFQHEVPRIAAMLLPRSSRPCTHIPPAVHVST